jgi:hypothetical protein
MKTGKYYLGLTIVIGILSSAVLGEVEPAARGGVPPEENEPLLIAQPNPTLAGVRKLYIVILPPNDEPNKDGLVWANLEAAVNSKISKAGIKVAEEIQREHVLRSLAIPELRININMLKLEESTQYVFHIETSLAKKVYLTKDVSRSIKADLWKTEPIIQAVPAEGMPDAVTSAVLEQVEAFIHAHLAANPMNKRNSGSDANDISEVAEEQDKPAAESMPSSQQDEPAKYKYAASKSGNVFHKPDCVWIKRIKPGNLAYYSSRDEATNAGKKPCKQCNP